MSFEEDRLVSPKGAERQKDGNDRNNYRDDPYQNKDKPWWSQDDPDHEEKNCQEGNLSFKKTGSLLLCEISTIEQVQLNETGAAAVRQFLTSE